jgi:hypothetical protein
MARSNFPSLFVMAALSFCLLSGGSVAQQRTLKEQLVGVWTLASNEATAPNGTKRQDFGANPKGILILDTGGRYALVQGRPDRPKFTAGNNVRVDTPAAEFGEAARAFAANFGTWSVNEADKTLIRRYEAALIPNAEGSETKVTVSLTGDELKLTGADAVGLRTDAVYRRAK